MVGACCLVERGLLPETKKEEEDISLPLVVPPPPETRDDMTRVTGEVGGGGAAFVAPRPAPAPEVAIRATAEGGVAGCWEMNAEAGLASVAGPLISSVLPYPTMTPLVFFLIPPALLLDDVVANEPAPPPPAKVPAAAAAAAGEAGPEVRWVGGGAEVDQDPDR